MPKPIMFLIIGLFFGTGLGFLIAATSGAELEGHDHDHGAAHDHAAHDHGDGAHTGGHDHSKLTEVTGPAPTLSIALHPDGPQSRNLEIVTENFTFDPTGVNKANVNGHGHAHIYVNGVKQARAYSPWVQLHALPKGTHEIRVTLNANDHSHLAVNGVALEVTETLVIE